MSSSRFRRIVLIAVILILIGTNTFALPADEREYFGKRLSHWINVLRDRDQEVISLAFDAIRAAGPDATAAVPDLARKMLKNVSSA